MIPSDPARSAGTALAQVEPLPPLRRVLVLVIMAAANSESLPVLRPPVILLGMHRSGTSLIARLLDDLGLFQGAELQDDHESVYFMDVNDLLLKRVGAAWDNPGPVRGFLDNSDALRLTAACVRADLESK